jgi:predicted nucleotidyltransferase
MKHAHDIPETSVQAIGHVLDGFPQVDRAMLFGSRAKGTHRRGSDIDLALMGRGLDIRILGRIADALDDLLLPYRFSLIRYDGDTDPDVAAHIQRVGLTLYDRATLQPSTRTRSA